MLYLSLKFVPTFALISMQMYGLVQYDLPSIFVQLLLLYGALKFVLYFTAIVLGFVSLQALKFVTEFSLSPSRSNSLQTLSLLTLLSVALQIT